MDGVKVDMVNADEMTEEERNAVFNQEASVDAIPDLDILTGNVLEILEYLEQTSVKKILRSNETAIKMHLNNKYADTVPLGIITLLMDERNRNEHIDRLLRVFDSLRKAKGGEIDIDAAEKNLTDDVNERYVYSKYGSKEAFEKALADEVKKEQCKKKRNIDISDIGNVSIKN